MKINELKSLLDPFLKNRIIQLYNFTHKQGKRYNDYVGFGNYVLINKLDYHYSIEILAFKISQIALATARFNPSQMLPRNCMA